MEKTKEKKVRTPKNPKRIFDGALKLSLEEKIELTNILKGAIGTELKQLEEKTKAARELLN